MWQVAPYVSVVHTAPTMLSGAKVGKRDHQNAEAMEGHGKAECLREIPVLPNDMNTASEACMVLTMLYLLHKQTTVLIRALEPLLAPPLLLPSREERTLFQSMRLPIPLDQSLLDLLSLPLL